MTKCQRTSLQSINQPAFINIAPHTAWKFDQSALRDSNGEGTIIPLSILHLGIDLMASGQQRPVQVRLRRMNTVGVSTRPLAGSSLRHVPNKFKDHKQIACQAMETWITLRHFGTSVRLVWIQRSNFCTNGIHAVPEYSRRCPKADNIAVCSWSVPTTHQCLRPVPGQSLLRGTVSYTQNVEAISGPT